LILEQALYTLPEIMAFPATSEFYESSLSSAYVVALTMELAKRGIQNPHLAVQQEVPYREGKSASQSKRADIVVELGMIFGESPITHSYGFRPRDVVEVKWFRPGPSGRVQAKTQKAGRLAADLVRVALLPRVLNTRERTEGKYVLHAYSGEPSKYLAFHRGGRGNDPRTWLTKLTTPGRQSLTVDLAGETDTLKSTVGEGLGSLRLDLDVYNTIVEPVDVAFERRDYRFILTRIIAFSVVLDGASASVESVGHLDQDDMRVFDEIVDKVALRLA